MRTVRYLVTIFTAVAVVILSGSLAGLPGTDIAHAQSTSASANCAALASANFETVPGAPTAIISTSVVSNAGTLPTYCDVQGYVTPTDVFDLRMPVATWNGNFYFGGCGGECGNPSADICNNALSQNYAVVASDTGHESSGLSALWAYNSPQTEIDFGYRSVHVVALAAKAIITKYYGAAPKYSFFSGCSTGGREALMEATRYPGDFNGIIAGDPVQYESLLVGVLHAWAVQINQSANGSEILTPAQIPLISNAVYKACAGTDGLINNPYKCDFNPTSLQCAAGAAATNCLTPDQVKVLQELYAGPRTAAGKPIYPGGFGLPKGSEGAWPGADINKGGTSLSKIFATQFLRYLAFRHDPGPSFTLSNYNPTAPGNIERILNYGGKILDVTSPNLSAFFARGGKLIMYSGWADQLVPPAGTVAYYESVVKADGGPRKASGDVRLFMFPGVYHCGGGPGPGTYDSSAAPSTMLPALANWVENGTTPAYITGTHVANGVVTLKMNIYPYPAAPKVVAP